MDDCRSAPLLIHGDVAAAGAETNMVIAARGRVWRNIDVLSN